MFSRWKLAIVLEGSYAKFLRGESKKPVHEYFGKQADQLLASRARPRRGVRPVTTSGEFELDADEIVAAAIVILRERGLDAVEHAQRARIGSACRPCRCTPRVGNKAALIDAVAAQLLVDLAPPAGAAEPWPEYAERWCRELRQRLMQTPDSRLYLGAAREPYVEASRPLVAALRGGGLSADAAVQACRLLMWATVGFVAMEQGSSAPAPDARRGRLSGSDPGGVTPEEADELFDLQIGILTAGIARLHAGDDGRRCVRRLNPVRRPRGNGDEQVRWGVLSAVVALVASGTVVSAGAQSADKEKPTATDVGITPTEIHIATIADVDNSFAPGLFKASVDGVRGVVKYINATGGLAGRKLVMDFYDSHVNPNDTRAAEISACQNDVAMVGTSAALLNTVAEIRDCKDASRGHHGVARHPVLRRLGRPLVLERVVPDRAAGAGLLHQGRPPADLPGERRSRSLVPAEVRRRPARHLRVRQRLASGA